MFEVIYKLTVENVSLEIEENFKQVKSINIF